MGIKVCYFYQWRHAAGLRCALCFNGFLLKLRLKIVQFENKVGVCEERTIQNVDMGTLFNS